VVASRCTTLVLGLTSTVTVLSTLELDASFHHRRAFLPPLSIFLVRIVFVRTSVLWPAVPATFLRFFLHTAPPHHCTAPTPFRLFKILLERARTYAPSADYFSRSSLPTVMPLRPLRLLRFTRHCRYRFPPFHLRFCVAGFRVCLRFWRSGFCVAVTRFKT